MESPDEKTSVYLQEDSLIIRNMKFCGARDCIIRLARQSKLYKMLGMFFACLLPCNNLSADHGKLTQTTGGLAGTQGVGGSYLVGSARSSSGLWSSGHGLAHHHVENLKHTAARATQRLVFYNNSVYDGFDPALNSSDDGAVASDKAALLAGMNANFSHYTSFSHGINGLMVDVINLNADLTTEDFSFKIGNNSNPGSWNAAPAPISISHRVGEGLNGTDRVTIVWADGAILAKWLEIKIQPSSDTGFLVEDQFFFGNAIGETGDGSLALVNSTDLLRISLNLIGAFDPPATVTSLYDINRDGLVNAQDYLITRSNPTSPVDGSALELILVPRD